MMSTSSPAVPADTKIVKAAIYPPIGIARVGNSLTEYYLGPEVTAPVVEPTGYRDHTGAIKRQAARFRIYGLNAANEVVAELTTANADVTWHVTLANTKAAWYQFQIALDIPEANDAPPSFLRNMAVADRSVLAITPGERTISGPSTEGPRFDSGSFMGTEVYLGELRTDASGRLIVLGGLGKSASWNGARAITFANNEGWHDDTSDGPVRATVRYQGTDLAVAPGWVVVAPPDYAPLQKSVRTMWDLMRDLFVSTEQLTKPAQPSFENDIRPIFERLSNLQWVNAGFAAAFGWSGSTPFSSSEWMQRLASPDERNKEWRKVIYNQFRQFQRDAWAPSPWPWLYGDAMAIPAADTPRQNTALSNLQLDLLCQWAAGDFIADYDPAATPPRNIDEVPVPEQPDMLTRAAMEFCLADAFHPGCEMTWPMRQASMYESPFRLKHRPPGWVEPDYGAVLTPDNISGPCSAQIAGGITRWMAVPWQTDTASCRSGYEKAYDPFVPTFWPARVPNQVMSARTYSIVTNPEIPVADRLAAFAKRAEWIRPLGNGGYESQINSLIADIAQMGVVELRPGPKDVDIFPSQLQVEQLPTSAQQGLLKAAVPEDFKDIDLANTEKARHLRRHRS